MRIVFEHVKGHSGEKWNDRADYLANLGSAGQTCGVARFSGKNLCHNENNDVDSRINSRSTPVNDDEGIQDGSMTIITANNRHKLQKLGITVDDLRKKNEINRRDILDVEREDKSTDELSRKRNKDDRNDSGLSGTELKDNASELDPKRRIKASDSSVIDLTDY
eukprot:CAMPEP_0119052454 /NCGR_PEP_ID=MMETSP1177-20130426/73748_1 /TAXON_ID=2985 /ORGANISM="Ochromonas sp, Strain CCMP1899" /LENGTH=163 /DNA_ID=CAMNT_0007032027 /DNA_START=821 /DNA_END=1312 /DNA_ORIENTATION=-